MNLPAGEELNNLLQIWDLDIHDINFLTSPAEDSIASSERLGKKLCTDCNASNVSDANWCIECGVALIGQSDPVEAGASINSWIPEAVVKSSTKTSFCSQIKSDEHDYNGDTRPLIKRHWETSKSYLWRKPSSIPISKSENTSSISQQKYYVSCILLY